ncbi:hypothetical protein HD806DRAFT_540368 [Xylariaceae sp. AK1471]|nr:hypothetical protein HD806DRAFT_540368 [Xylariaceae sp. AK1471]
MPSPKIDDVLSTKPVTFKLKTSGGLWKCQIHPTRAAYERAKVTTPMAPGLSRTDSGFSTTSSSSAGSTTSWH